MAEIRRPPHGSPTLLHASSSVLSLSLHWILMWGGIPVRVAGHVAVGRHVYTFGRGRDVPDWRDGRGARGEGHGDRDGVVLVRVAALLEQLLELWPLILEPDLYLWGEGREGSTHLENDAWVKSLHGGLLYLQKQSNELFNVRYNQIFIKQFKSKMCYNWWNRVKKAQQSVSLPYLGLCES